MILSRNILIKGEKGLNKEESKYSINAIVEMYNKQLLNKEAEGCEGKELFISLAGLQFKQWDNKWKKMGAKIGKYYYFEEKKFSVQEKLSSTLNMCKSGVSLGTNYPQEEKSPLIGVPKVQG